MHRYAVICCNPWGILFLYLLDLVRYLDFQFWVHWVPHIIMNGMRGYKRYIFTISSRFHPLSDTSIIPGDGFHANLAEGLFKHAQTQRAFFSALEVIFAQWRLQGPVDVKRTRSMLWVSPSLALPKLQCHPNHPVIESMQARAKECEKICEKLVSSKGMFLYTEIHFRLHGDLCLTGQFLAAQPEAKSIGFAGC